MESEYTQMKLYSDPLIIVSLLEEPSGVVRSITT